MYKSNVGDFSLIVHPCKHWWVRYAVACTYFSDLHDKMLDAYLKYKNISTDFAYTGKWNDRTIWIYKEGKQVELDRESEEYKIIHAGYIKNDFIFFRFSIKFNLFSLFIDPYCSIIPLSVSQP